MTTLERTSRVLRSFLHNISSFISLKNLFPNLIWGFYLSCNFYPRAFSLVLYIYKCIDTLAISISFDRFIDMKGRWRKTVLGDSQWRRSIKVLTGDHFPFNVLIKLIFYEVSRRTRKNQSSTFVGQCSIDIKKYILKNIYIGLPCSFLLFNQKIKDQV